VAGSIPAVTPRFWTTKPINVLRSTKKEKRLIDPVQRTGLCPFWGGGCDIEKCHLEGKCTGVREKEGKSQRKGRKRKRENEVERVKCKTFKNKDRRGAEE
jgi:hypothetical protein